MRYWVLLLYGMLLLLAHSAVEQQGLATGLNNSTERANQLDGLEEAQAFCYVRQELTNDYTAIADEQWELVRQLDRRGTWASDEDRKKLLLRNFFLTQMTQRQEWSTRRHETLVHLLANQVGLPTVSPQKVVYPWDDLEEWMQEQNMEKLPLVAFGSLIHTGSAQVDIGGLGYPIIAFGLRRHFNYLHLRPELSFLGLPNEKHLEESARLNVSYSGHASDIINGLLLEVDTADLDRLRLREKGYDLIKVYVLDYSEAVDAINSTPQFREAFVLSTPEGSLHRSSSFSLMPHMNYATICIEGAYTLEASGMPGFLDLFLTTTYLNDGRTLDQWVTDLARHEAKRVQHDQK